MGDFDKALPLLENVLDSGYPMHLIEADPELAALRKHDAYPQLVLAHSLD
jgi:hypothetical protein